MLIDQILQDAHAAAKAGDKAKATLLSTLHAEAAAIGKDAKDKSGAWAPRASTDEEVLGRIKKFAQAARENVAACGKLGRDDAPFRREIEILDGYLPKQMTEAELEAAVRAIVAGLPEKSPKAMGQVMGALKQAHGGSYDGAAASRIVKAVLAG